MPNEYDAIIIGAGHNGLVTAAYLARAGLRTLVLESRGVVGGACVTEEIFPGYKFSTTSYLCSLMQEKVTRDLELEKFGFTVYPKDPAFFSPFPDGRHLIMGSDTSQTCREIAKFSARDAERYPHYEEYVDRLARFIEPLLLETPPDITGRGLADWQKLAGLGRRVMKMPAEELIGHLHILSQSVKDFLDPWFESEALKVALATDGVIGTKGGPYTPGTAYVLLHHVMGGVGGKRGLWGFVRGGMGGVASVKVRCISWPMLGFAAAKGCRYLRQRLLLPFLAAFSEHDLKPAFEDGPGVLYVLLGVFFGGSYALERVGFDPAERRTSSFVGRFLLRLRRCALQHGVRKIRTQNLCSSRAGTTA